MNFMNPNMLHEKIFWFQKKFEEIEKTIGQIIIGQEDVLKQTIIAFLARGHVLLEGLPGLGKTLLTETFSQILGISYKRIQFTPDLMPADILGTNVLWKDSEHMPVLRFE